MSRQPKLSDEDDNDDGSASEERDPLPKASVDEPPACLHKRHQPQEFEQAAWQLPSSASCEALLEPLNKGCSSLACSLKGA